MKSDVLSNSDVPTKKPRISVVVDEDLLEYLERWADEEERSVSNLALKLIKDGVKQRQKDEQPQSNPPKS